MLCGFETGEKTNGFIVVLLDFVLLNVKTDSAEKMRVHR